jgi:hypothetical protein
MQYKNNNDTFNANRIHNEIIVFENKIPIYGKIIAGIGAGLTIISILY